VAYIITALLVNFCQVCRVLFSERLVQIYIFDGVMNFKQCNLQSIFYIFTCAAGHGICLILHYTALSDVGNKELTRKIKPINILKFVYIITY